MFLLVLFILSLLFNSAFSFILPQLSDSLETIDKISITISIAFLIVSCCVCVCVCLGKRKVFREKSVFCCLFHSLLGISNVLFVVHAFSFGFGFCGENGTRILTIKRIKYNK